MKQTTTYFAAGILVVIASLSPTVSAPLGGQEATISALTSITRSGKTSPEVHLALRGMIREWSPQEREQLADSLVAIAISGDDMAAASAVRAFANAGWVGAERPYPGTKERLLSIIRQTDDQVRQLKAFSALLKVPGAPSELELILEFVRRPDPDGALALLEVVRLGDPRSEFFSEPGEALLRRVATAGGFQSEIVTKQLARIAEERGWKPGG